MRVPFGSTLNRRWSALALGAALAVGAFADSASAVGTAESRDLATAALPTLERELAAIPNAPTRVRSNVTPERRLAEGELLLANRDFERATMLFNQVVELHSRGGVSENTHAEAVALLAETYFDAGELLAARRQYLKLLDRYTDAAFSGFAGRALARLVDIALQSNRQADIEDLAVRADKLPASDALASLPYARAKLAFARGDLDKAEAMVGTVPPGTAFAVQSQYLLGVVFAKRGMSAAPPAPGTSPESAAGANRRFAKAIDQFRRVTRLPADTAAHRHVIDLAWMAIGRLFYEAEGYADSAEAYSHIERRSPEFSSMLFELAWVYVRMGDFERARRSLEVLSIIDPKSMKQADSSLLRADLMLRSGQLKKALTLYRGVRGRFDPVRQRLEAFLEKNSDPAVYYDKLVAESLESTSGDNPLPPMAVEWAREVAEESRAFAVVDDVARSRKLLKQTQRILRRLESLLSSPARAKAFPELQARLESATAVVNRAAQLRALLSRGLEDLGLGSNGEFAALAARRRAVDAKVDALPVSRGDFSRREADGERQWNKLSQALQRLTLSADRLQAIVNGLRRVMTEADKNGVTKDPAIRERFQKEIESNEHDLDLYRRRIRDYQDAVEVGRVQVGFGDQRFVADDEARREMGQVSAREFAAASAGSGGDAGRRWAESVAPIMERLRRIEAAGEDRRARYLEAVRSEADALFGVVRTEGDNVRNYTAQLDKLDDYARLVVGKIALESFEKVRDQLRSVVLRADVGIVQQAWETRVEQQARVTSLRRERAREGGRLDAELREVLDDASEEEK